tara:strand:- start:490 stop:1281 length:792 start_codon:yes stop_codon:yes gene_type:complete
MIRYTKNSLMKRKNNLKEKLMGGGNIIGTWSSMSSVNSVNAIGLTSLDFIIIDMEHGLMSFETAEKMVLAAEACGISPIIRTYDHYQQTLLRTLETGVMSIMVPHVKNAKDAKNIVKCCKYFPKGNRGLSPYTRVHDYNHLKVEKSTELENNNTFIGILVEGKEGLKNLENISKVPDIDLIYLGLFDICQSLGLPGQINHPKVIEEVKRCEKIISSKGIAPGSMAIDLPSIKFLKDQNYKFIAYLNDAAALKQHYIDILSKIW